jgi:hypothetical protein
LCFQADTAAESFAFSAACRARAVARFAVFTYRQDKTVVANTTSPPDAIPLQPIRSLYYLLPVIDEVLQLRISQDYFRYLQFHINRIQQKNTNP